MWTSSFLPSVGTSEAGRELFPGHADEMTVNLARIEGDIIALAKDLTTHEQVEEGRQFDVAGDGTDYVATVTYYDHADRPLEVRAPDGAIQRYQYPQL